MTEAAKKSLDVQVLCIYQEMGETFVQAVRGEEAAGAGLLTIDGYTLSLEVLAGDPRVNPAWEETIKDADALIVLVRFMDVISMDKIKSIYRHLPNDQSVPLAFILFREEGETDFKISCTACGQKLWVRDQDVGKRGRCPNCKTAFRLPAQKEHLKEQLMVPDAVPIMMVDRGHPATARKAVTKLLERLTGDTISEEQDFDPNVLKQSTMRIQVQPGDTTHEG